MTNEELVRWAEDQADAVRAERFAYRSKGGTMAYHHKGAGHSRAKLDEEAVRKIRLLRAQGHKLEVIAACYGVHKSTIQYALKRGWKHVK